MVEQNKKKGFAALEEAERRYDERAKARNNRKQGNRKSVRRGDEYYEW